MSLFIFPFLKINILLIFLTKEIIIHIIIHIIIQIIHIFKYVCVYVRARVCVCVEKQLHQLVLIQNVYYLLFFF